MAQNPDSKNSDRIPRKSSLFIFIIIIIILWISYFFIFGCISDSWKNNALIGDAYGGLNTLFSGLAFAGIIYTIFLQRQELSLQREELKATREELKRTANAQEASTAQLNRQANNLKITSELNAINTLLLHYQNRLKKARGVNPAEVLEIERTIDGYVNRAEQIANRKNQD